MMGTTNKKGGSDMKHKLFIISTGLILAAALAGCSPAAQTGGQSAYIGVEDAKAAALSAAQVDSADAQFSVAELWDHDGEQYYEVDFTAGGQEYHYAIDAVTGMVIESGTGAAAQQSAAVQGGASTQQGTAGDGQIGEDEAKRIALEDAGVAEADTTYMQVKRDRDDGTEVYDVEFYVASTGTEYDYEINAADGTIRSLDHDAENYTPSQSGTGTDTVKTEQEVRDIALAKVPGATEKDISLSLDRDDGRMSYEGKIIFEGMEYDFEIDAYSGAIREWDAESVFDD